MGFSKELFLNDVDDEFTCSICLNVFDDPVQDNEEHMFCRECITEWLNVSNRTCPISRNYLNSDHLKKPFRVMLNLLSKLEMKCCNESKGCKEVFLLESYYGHMKVCEYDPSKYFNCGTCGLSISIKHSNKEHDCLESLKEHVNVMQKSIEERNNKILGLEINLCRTESLVKNFQRKYDHQNMEANSLKEKITFYEHKIARFESSLSKSHEEKNSSVLDNSFKKKSKLPRLFPNNITSRHPVNANQPTSKSLFLHEVRRKKTWNSSTLVGNE